MSNMPPPATWPPATPPTHIGPPQWLALVSLGVALLAIGVALGAWFRPLAKHEPPPPAPSYTSEQVAEAKAKVCAAYAKVHQAIKASSSREVGVDETARFAFAINGRQALLAGSGYLRTVLSAQAATPSELKVSTRKISDIYEELVIDYLNGLADSQMKDTLNIGNEEAVRIEALCK
ncbi:hypothetical protein [Mycobacterium asiaticum]|uniref:hypothetical protein n=1 Tax=Mycobacterium asiaticum TaxID=1790 RepID=UPI0012DB7256|nr:hypothetical protein [Mycobacterium asiaticum]